MTADRGNRDVMILDATYQASLELNLIPKAIFDSDMKELRKHALSAYNLLGIILEATEDAEE